MYGDKTRAIDKFYEVV